MTRISVAAACVITAGVAFCQSGVVPIAKIEKTAPPTTIDTRQFFPQIDEHIASRGLVSPNESFRPIPQGIPNNLQSGGVGGTSNAILGARFAGVDYTGFVPPDCNLAVGPNNIIATANTTMAFFSKTGTKQFQTTLDSRGFFKGVALATDFQSDPKVFYDKISKRFFVVILNLDFGAAQRSFLMIGVSDTSDPNGTWKRFLVDNVATDSNNNKLWLDYPGWGFNKDAVVATGNMFGFGAGGGVVQALVMKKSEMLAGAATTVTKFLDPNASTLQVAYMQDANIDKVYGVCIESTSSMRVYAWTNLNGTPVMQFKSVNVPQFTRAPGTADSTGNGVHDVLNDRVLNAAYRSGSLVTGHAAGTTTGKAQVAWYEFKTGSWPTSGTVTLGQAGKIAGAPDVNLFMPALNINAAKDISCIFCRSSSSISGDLMISTRKAVDPAGQMTTPKQLKPSLGSPNSFRWGDYFHIAIDPVDDLTFWGVGEISRLDSGWTEEIQSWKVSTSTGGGSGGIAVLPDGISVLEGTFKAGTLNSVKVADGLTYDSTSAFKSGIGYGTAQQLTFTLPFSRNVVDSFDISEKLNVNTAQLPTGTAYIWNFTTSRWELLKSNPVVNVNTSYVQTISTNVLNYIDSGNHIKVLVRVLNPIKASGTPPTSFNLSTDLVKLNVNQK